MPNHDGDLDITALQTKQIVSKTDSSLPLDKNQSYTTISHWYSRKNLFDKTPSITDVKQRAVGNCFLLAGLHAILQTNPKLIYGMMKDRRGGLVVVRLYDTAGQPVYYEIEKTYVTYTGGLSLQDHGAWWVYMLEKAYAFHRLAVGGHTVKPKEWVLDKKTNRLVLHEGKERAAKTYVEALSGGFTDDALQTLLGGSKVSSNWSRKARSRPRLST